MGETRFRKNFMRNIFIFVLIGLLNGSAFMLDRINQLIMRSRAKLFEGQREKTQRDLVRENFRKRMRAPIIRVF